MQRTPHHTRDDLIIFTQPLRSGRLSHKGIHSFPSPTLVAKESSLPYYLPIAGGRIIGFIPFPRVLVLCEMLSVSSRIWTRVAMSICYDDNHYTTGTSTRDDLMLAEKKHHGYSQVQFILKIMLAKPTMTPQ